MESKPKSTGWRSQTAHFWGHATSIAEQLTAPGHMITKDMVAHALLHALVEEGEWPAAEIAGIMEPLSWSMVDSRLANVAIEYCHAFADEHGLYLYEYGPGGVAGKTWYGHPPEKEDA